MTLIISYAKVVNKNVYPPQTVVIYKKGGGIKVLPFYHNIIPYDLTHNRSILYSWAYIHKLPCPV